MSADAYQTISESFSLGAEIGAGYASGHLQESIYPSDPLDGADYGAGVWMALRPLSLGPAGLGARFTMEYHAIPVDWVFVSLFGLHADLQGDVRIGDFLVFYGFGGATIAGVSLSYEDSDDPVAEEGKGFRYGAGMSIRIINQPGFAVRVGPELAVHHIIYKLVIYHYTRIFLRLEASLK